MPSNQIPYTIRFEPEDFELVKRRHAETFPAHRLSFNTWLVRRIVRPLRRATKQPAAKHS